MNPNAGAMNPNDFLSTLGGLLQSTQAKDSAVAKQRAVRARFENMGANMRALDLMLKLRKVEPEDAEMLLRDALRYCRWASMKVGEQASLFGSDDAQAPSEKARGEWTEAQAYEEGYAAGKAGRSGTDHRFVAGTPVHQRFYQGWVDGQTLLAEMLGKERPPTGEPLKPERKKAGAKPKAGATPVAGKPKGRRGAKAKGGEAQA